MKTKIFTLMSLSILALITLVSFVSATTSTVIDITNINAPTSVNENAGSFTFTFNLTYTGASTAADISFADSTSSIGTISIPTAEDMNGTADESRTITGTISNFANQGGNTMNLVINATTGSSRDDENTFSVVINDVSTTSDNPEEVTDCETIGNPSNNLRVKSIEFTNNGMKTGNSPIEFGEDDSWFLLDDIEVEIEVENNGDEDIDNVEIEWGVWDTRNDEWIIELDNENDFDIKDGDEELVTVSFNIENALDIDLEDLTDGTYRFYVVANGYDNEIEEDVCASDYEETDIVVEEDFVVLSKFQFPESVTCGDEVQIIASVWNIGDSDQDEVSVRIFNTELGITKQIEIGDIDAFDKEDLNVAVEIPADADEKTYSINFEVYDEDNDVYETDFDDDPAEFHVLLTVGSCSTQAEAFVSASLQSGGMAGEQLVVRATITNTGDEAVNYNINTAGYASWAALESVQPNTMLVNKGESKEILITFNVKEDTVGEQTFNIEVLSDGEMVLTQPVSVSIEEAPKGFLSGITGNVIGGGNTYLWLIGALNVLLVIIIIIVAIRVARK